MYKIFLQEGKKEDAIQKVKEMFSSPEDAEMIDKIFDATSSLGTKFIPFVENETKRYLIDQNTDINDFINLWIQHRHIYTKGFVGCFFTLLNVFSQYFWIHRTCTN